MGGKFAQRSILANAKRIGGDHWQSAAFLLASAVFGTDPDKIGAELGLDLTMCHRWADVARQNGIWEGERVAGAEWFADGGGIALALDVAVLEGFLTRSDD